MLWTGLTHLRQIMLEELRRRNYAESTIHAYIQTVEHFSRHFYRSPDQLGPELIRQYQAALFTRWKLAPNTVTQRLAALRFFYVQVLKRGWSVAETPHPADDTVCHGCTSRRVARDSLAFDTGHTLARQEVTFGVKSPRTSEGHRLSGERR